MSAYTDAVAAGLEGMEGVSTGTCPGCPECMERDGITDAGEHHNAWQHGDTCDESHFSWAPCGICGSTLGGDRHVWHWINRKPGLATGIYHEDDACIDCVMYLANGDEPERWGWNATGHDVPDDIKQRLRSLAGPGRLVLPVEIKEPK